MSLVLFDFDGVMTDNHVWVDQSGAEAVRCHRGDGLGIARLKENKSKLARLKDLARENASGNPLAG